MLRLALIVVVITVTACKTQNPDSCELPGNVDKPACTAVDADPDGPGCDDQHQCTSGVCSAGECVECLRNLDCASNPNGPTCDVGAHTCRPCAAHTDCDSQACLPTGACGDDTNVAYVDPMGTDNATCTKATACTEVAKALATDRPFVKFTGTTNEQVTLNNKTVTFIADPGAKLSDTSNGILLKLEGPGTVSIFDLEITGASGANNSGISLQPGTTASLTLTRTSIHTNQGSGITMAGGSLTITQSTLFENLGGGIAMTTTGVVSITNNFIHHNGNTSNAAFGGLSLKPIGASKVEFNTIVDNQANGGVVSAGGVFCDTAAFVAANNLVFRNTGGVSGKVQTVGLCTYGNSFNMPGASSTENTPAFVNPNSPPFDYRLTTATPLTVRNAAGACVGVDFENEPRPSGGACDLGADELQR